tara:strand:+ start:3369 stop:3545 length:177 start_codon:yes stop_codon:yes gene_type:complete
MKITLETPDNTDQESLAAILEDVAAFLRENDDPPELMDGSFRIDTRHGVTFLEPNPET